MNKEFKHGFKMDIYQLTLRLDQVEEQCRLSHFLMLRDLDGKGHIRYSSAAQVDWSQKPSCLKAIWDFNREVDSYPKFRRILSRKGTQEEFDGLSRLLGRELLTLRCLAPRKSILLTFETGTTRSKKP